MDYEYLKFINANGFQKTDDKHPPGTGKAGYRIAFKTLKLLPLPGAQLQWPNLRVQFRYGKTSKGGIRVDGAMKSRRPNIVIMPEYIDEQKDAKGTKFVGRTNMKFKFQAWDDEIDDSGIVEILLITDAQQPQQILNEGRLHLSKMKVILELAGSQKLLGIPVAEEVVEIFPDWYWNRNMSSLLVGTESELNLERLNTEEFLEKIKPAIESTQTISEEKRRQIAFASSWYWKAESEADPINRFIEYWVAIESLEMPNSTNIRPIRQRLALITGDPEEKWAELVGRLASLRSELIHGRTHEMAPEKIELIRYLLLTLLYFRLFRDNNHEVIQRFKKLSEKKY